MATVGLPPPPINDAPGSFTWLEWYRQLRNYISTSGSVPWYIINFADSNLADIQNKDHNILDNLQGGAAGERYHLTAAQYAGLGGGEHNDLLAIQGGSATERYHLTEAQWLSLGGGGSFLPTTGGTMTGPINFLGTTGSTGSLEMLPDVGTPGADALHLISEDGIIVRAPYLILDSDQPVLTMPGPTTGARVIVSAIDSFGGAILGYESAPEPGYSVQDTHDANVIIKAAGSVPPTAWVELGLEVTLTEDIPAGYGNVAFEMILQNITNRSGVVEFGFNYNGTILNREITQQITPNFEATVATSLALANGYFAGDNIKLVARVTSNSNNGFALTMLASPTDLAVFRIYTVGGTSIFPSDNLPLMDGTAAAGTSDEYTRADHVHPSDTSRAPFTHVGATGSAHGIVTTSVNGFMIAADKTKLDGIATGAKADHGLLTGLTDDDHLQYHTDARGDARYTLIAHTGATGNAHGLATAMLNGFMSSIDKSKLDNIAPEAQTGTVTQVSTSGAISGGPITTTGTITHQDTDGYKHVPANGTTNAGKVLTASAVAGTYTWETPTGGGAAAIDISFTPYLTITSTNVQDAVQELKDELDTLKSQLYAYG